MRTKAENQATGETATGHHSHHLDTPLEMKSVQEAQNMCLEERDTRILAENLAELTTRVTRLEESNKALEEALLEGPDEDYSLALTENKEVLARTRETIARIEKALKEAQELESQMAALEQTTPSERDTA